LNPKTKLEKTDKAFLEKVRSKAAKAIEDYGLIEESDRVLVALSGGKDSATLLDILHNRRKYFGFHYDLAAAYIDLNDVPYHVERERIRQLCEVNDIPLYIIEDDTKVVTGKKHPCFYCAWTRRRLLFDFAVKNGYNKLAFGHNRDDMVETFLMNMIYHGEASAFPVKLSMFDNRMDIIRPLIYIGNKEAERYIELIGFKAQPYNCPYAEGNDREKFRALLQQLYSFHPHVADNLLKAMKNIRPEYLPLEKNPFTS